MPINAGAVGALYPPRDLDLTARDLLSFAAGLQIDWPLLMDDAAPDSIVGFPTYCASLEFNAFGDAAAIGANPTGYTEAEGRRGVHVGQDSVFHRPLRPGDRLRTTGQIVSARQSGAGALVVVRAQTQCRLTGALVCTSWISHLFRDVPLAGDAQVIASPPEEPSLPGGPTKVVQVPVSRTWPHIYAECSGIWNPIHSEREVALAAGLQDVIFQGTATWGLAAREIIDTYCGRDPRRLKRLSTRFAGMVYPDDVLSISIGQLRDGFVAYSVANQHGSSVLRNGFAEID